MQRWIPFVVAASSLGVAVAPGCNGDVVVDTAGPGGGGNAGEGGVISYVGGGGVGGYGGDVSPVGGYGGDIGGYGGDIGGGPPASCDYYCQTILTNCTGNESQYGDYSSCIGVCAAFPSGNQGDTSGDTLGCRSYHASDPAAADPMTHCPHAGPLGGAVCSESDCSAFCHLATLICGAQPQPPYPDQGTCEMYCATFPDTSKVPYNSSVTAGDSLACRMYHLSVAATGPDYAGVHCPHVGPKSDPCQ